MNSYCGVGVAKDEPGEPCVEGKEESSTRMVDVSACVLVRVACRENGSCVLRRQPLALETVQIGNSSISHLEGMFPIRVLCNLPTGFIGPGFWSAL